MKFIRHVIIAVALSAAAGPSAAQDNAARQAREARERARQQAQDARQRAAEERRQRAEEQRGPEHVEQFARTVRLGRNGTFELSNVTGDITVTGGGGDDVRIEATKRVRHRDAAEARRLLQAIQIAVAERSGLVEVRTDLPRRRNWSGGVEYRVTVPSAANVTVQTVSGDLRLTNVGGELRAETVNGDIVARSLGRVRALRTVSGDLELTEANAEELSLSTVSGDVIARGIKARAVDFESVSGNMRMSEGEVERITAKAISGDVGYDGRLARSGRYDLQTHSGDIRLVIAGNAGFDLDASTFTGDVRSEFQLSGGGAQRAAAGARGPRSRVLRGTTGDASAVLTLRTFNGDVLITRR